MSQPVQESKSAQNMAVKYCEGQNTQKHFTGIWSYGSKRLHQCPSGPWHEKTQFEVNPWLSNGFEVDRTNRQSLQVELVSNFNTYFV